MNIIDVAQGSPAWHAHRASHFNASDAPAMLGLSPYKTRSELLREIATGITPEIDPATQRRFDDGHRFEALARPVAEKILGEELFPVVGYEGKLSASFDGLTMDGAVCFEHKTLNATYRAAIATGSPLPDALLVQIEQQLFMSQAERCLFMASRWNDDDTLAEEVHCMVESDPDLLARVLKGWEQFQHDLENYQHSEVIVAPVATPIESLPALAVTVSGSISLTHNLERFGTRLTEFVGNLNSKPETDQDFVDLDAAVKVLKEAEAQLDAAEKNALAQTTTIADMCGLVEMYRKVARDNRLMFEKIVKAEKESRRTEIIKQAQIAITDHVRKLNERIGGQWMPVSNFAPFSEAVKGLKSLDSMRDKVSTALANAKVEADMLAERIEINKRTLDAQDDIYMSLFPDLRTIITKPNGDFMDTVNARIAAYKAAEAEKAEAARKAEDERVAAAVEAERVRAAAEAAKPAANDQGGKAEPVGGAVPAIASTPPIQQSDMGQSLDGLAGRSARLTSAPRGEAVPIPDATMIDDFIRLLSIAPVAKKALRADIVAWETYRIKTMAARGLAVAA